VRVGARIRLPVALVLMLLLAALPPRPLAWAAPVTMMNRNDSGPGSLRDAIAAAIPGDTITFQNGLSGPITLTSGELVVNKSLTISGRARASSRSPATSPAACSTSRRRPFPSRA
jgi:hypothetical protein